MRKVEICFLILALLLSGCISPIQTQESKDIRVELKVDTTTIPAGGKLGVTMNIENYAEFEISNITAWIYGPPGWEGDIGVSRSYGKLAPYGTGYEFNWTLRAPSDVTYKKYYKIFGDIRYKGYTRKVVTITGVSYDYYKRTGSSSGFSVSESLGGPIEIDIVPSQSQLIAYEADTLPFKFSVIISNKGKGKPCSDYECKNIGKVIFSFSRLTSNVEIACEKVGEINLIKSAGRYAHFECSGNLTNVKEISTQLIGFIVNYTYMETLSSPTITVEPVRFER